jgi:hypothetical protein
VSVVLVLWGSPFKAWLLQTFFDACCLYLRGMPARVLQRLILPGFWKLSLESKSRDYPQSFLLNFGCL